MLAVYIACIWSMNKCSKDTNILSTYIHMYIDIKDQGIFFVFLSNKPKTAIYAIQITG